MDPFLRDALVRILRGTRNGAVYGAKVRFAHAMVMAILFGRAPWPARIKGVILATARHAWTLARFAFTYKSMLLAQALLFKRKRTAALGTAASATPSETFIAGAVGGLLVFGSSPQPVAEQIVLYLISRVLVGASRHYSAGTVLDQPQYKHRAWQLTSAIAWGSVMYLFHVDADVLHSSLAKSMRYLYLKSDDIELITLDNFFGIL